MKHITRLLALVLALTMLAGCGAQAEREFGSHVPATQPTTEPAPTAPPQEEMPEEELAAALRRLEYAALCAAIDANIRKNIMAGMYQYDTQTYLGDYDGDGTEDLVYGPYATTFGAANRCATYMFSQSGITMYTDNTGTLYLEEYLDGSYDYEQDGMWIAEDSSRRWYCTWNGSVWESVLESKSHWAKEIISDENGQFLEFGKTLEETESAAIGDREVSVSEYEAHLESIGLKEIDTHPADFTQNSFDGVYADHLLTELEAYLSGIYSGVQRITADVDSDGYGESLFFIQRIADPWLESLTTTAYHGEEEARYYLSQTIDPDSDQVCMLVADLDGSDLVVDAHCILGDLSIHADMDARREGSFLWLDGCPVYLGGGFAQTADASMLASYVNTYGYTDCLIKSVDVTDFTGTEYMCLCQKDGVWYLLIFVFENGDPRPVYNLDLNNTAVYLVEQDGKQCLLTYSQRIKTYTNGRTYTSYDYNLRRFDTDGGVVSLDYQFVGYYNDDADATQVAQFFEKLNVYLVKIIVVRDPYRLQGHMWLQPEHTDHGTAPAEPEPEQPEADAEAEQPVMGFVQINDPSSWLNLREGPGTEYPCVCIDPADPNSFVRQALGSPVTVLETIETGDAANPVWVKVRITYADREIVGYSSKTYIHIPGEE